MTGLSWKNKMGKDTLLPLLAVSKPIEDCVVSPKCLPISFKHRSNVYHLSFNYAELGKCITYKIFH